ncbi:myelin basic protein isoform X7 [Paralichthys olivaceus]|uniref:myelin basic protein isoform X7 n=1 Tax=Paralichthys olivaceus TaxID=8255 RepID=UPI00097D390F|nr:PREDICTED: myelin basic protein-like isoform X6 [Paralichthys olivaceus]
MSHGAPRLLGRHLQRRPPSVRKAANGAESCGPWTGDRKRTTEQLDIGQPHPTSATPSMATASSSGQSAFGLGRKKKNPGLMDQISKFFGGDKKKRSKGSFRGHLASSPQQSSARRRTNENAVVHFFRSIVSSPRPKSRGETKSRPPPKRWSTIF